MDPKIFIPPREKTKTDIERGKRGVVLCCLYSNDNNIVIQQEKKASFANSVMETPLSRSMPAASPFSISDDDQNDAEEEVFVDDDNHDISCSCHHDGEDNPHRPQHHDDDESIRNTTDSVVVPWWKPRERCLQLFGDHLSWSEAAGSVGDLGTFLPILVAMARQDLLVNASSSALWYAGLANVVTGYVWDVPMPVQPMKSIASTALIASTDTTSSSGNNNNNHGGAWTAGTVTAAGIWMGMILCVISATPGGIPALVRLVPRSVVAGMQVGVGLALGLHGLHWLFDVNDDSKNASQTLSWGWNDNLMDSRTLGLVTWMVCLYALHKNGQRTNTNMTASSSSSSPPPRPPPVALYVFGLAVVLAVVRLQWGKAPQPQQPDDNDIGDGFVVWAAGRVSWTDVSIGFWQGALPQLPLTLLNSVVSVCALADALFASTAAVFPDEEDTNAHHRHPKQGTAVLNPRHVAFSVGLLNLLACPLGAMPVCHGAGGLAGQYKCGARHGTSVVLLGAVKMIVAIAIPQRLLIVVLDALPVSLLAVLLLVAGHELAVTGIASVTTTTTTRKIIRSPLPRNNSAVDDDQIADCANAEASDDERIRTDVGVCLWTAAVIVGLHKTHYGALTGCVAACLMKKQQQAQTTVVGSWWRWHRVPADEY